MADRVTERPVYAEDFILDWITALQAAIANPLIDPASATIFLATAGPTPNTPQNVFADWTQAGGADFASIAVDPTVNPTPVNLPSGGGKGILCSFTWTLTAGAGPAPIIGYVVTDGTDLIMTEKFADPVAIVNVGDYCHLDVIFPLMWTPVI